MSRSKVWDPSLLKEFLALLSQKMVATQPVDLVDQNFKLESDFHRCGIFFLSRWNVFRRSENKRIHFLGSLSSSLDPTLRSFLSNRLLFNFNPCEEEISFGWNFESLLISDKLNVSEIGFGILETSDNKLGGTFVPLLIKISPLTRILEDPWLNFRESRASLCYLRLGVFWN